MNARTAAQTDILALTGAMASSTNFKKRPTVLSRSISGLALALFAFPGCQDTPGSRTLAEIQESTGNTFLVGSSGQGASRLLLNPGATMSPGQTIETDPAATATIALMPALVLRLNPESSLSIQELLLVKSGTALEDPMKSRQGRVRLARGSLFGSTPPIITHVDLEIATPAGKATAPALTVFYVGLEGEKIRAIVVAGQLRFRSKNGEPAETVTKRQFADWNATSGAMILAPSDVETDPGALQMLGEAAEFGRRAAELTATARKRPPPGR